MSQSIPISGLDPLSQISSSDYIPIVQNTSTTTFKTPLVILANWMSASVQTSSSLSTVSASYAKSASWANNAGSSSYSSVASNLIYPNTSTALNSISASFAKSASWAPFQVSASFANTSIFATSSSFASQSLTATTASFANTSIFTTSASFSSKSLVSVSSSFASQSISASYATNALTASFVASSVSGPKFIPSYYIGSFANTNTGWVTFDPTPYGVNANASTIILQLFCSTGQGPAYFFFRTNASASNASASTILTASVGALGGSDVAYMYYQQFIPTTTGAKFDYNIASVGSSTQMWIVGYF